MEKLQLSKTCTTCLEVLPLTDFHKNATSKHGVRTECKKCRINSRRKWYEKNQPKLIEQSKSYYRNNTEKSKSQIMKWRKKNSEHVRAYLREYRHNNRPQLLARKRADYLNRRTHYAAINRKYRQEHPEQQRASTLRRRTLKQNAPGFCSAEQWIAKCEYFGFCCYLCHIPLTIKTLETEHRIPLSRGGSNWPANLAPACTICNKKKRTMKEKEFRAIL